jgi:hypothetical protein
MSLLARTSCKLFCFYQLKHVILALELHGRFYAHVEEVERLGLVYDYYSILSMYRNLSIDITALGSLF